MKSTSNQRNQFTWEDFEKGLMLAGYLMPNSIADLNQRLVLNNYEKSLKKDKKGLYFRRVVLAAEIVSRLHQESTFGRVKFQKLVYLCEHVANMELQHRYAKLTAGPFDHKFMHTIELEFKKQHWFKVEKITERNITRSKYIPLEQCGKYKDYYDSYFGATNESINRVIELFKSKKTDFTEIAATLFYCFLEIKEENAVFSEEMLLEKFYMWSEKKKNFERSLVVSIWKWLQEENLVQII